MEALEKVQQLKTNLDGFRPLKPEAEARIMQKFRLDWNYHSNNIEGNSLTYGETKAFILFGITAGKKPFKDYLEIKGHNEAINWVVDLVKGDSELTQVFIRQLHELLLKESSESFAQMPDGKPTKKKIEVGKYKTLPNHVLTATGEMFYFATPEETPAKMQELIDWFRAERDKPDVNPIILATLFHYRFIRIHPFDDGNGRTARILMNFILMQNGFPPAIIKTEDKENYYGVLHLADVGELEPFIEYIAENLIHSLEIMIRGAKGEDIEEADDLDKELALLEQKIKTVGDGFSLIRSREVLHNLFDFSIKPLLLEFLKTSEKFDKFYTEVKKLVKVDKVKTYDVYNFTEIKKFLLDESKELEFRYWFLSFNKVGFQGFDFLSSFIIRFNSATYSISGIGHFFYEKSYTEQLTKKEIKHLIDVMIKKHKELIEDELEKVQKK